MSEQKKQGTKWASRFTKNPRSPRIRATKTASGFPSKLEEAVYNILLLREKAGEIKDIKRQHRLQFPCGIGWKIDFSATDCATGDTVYFEAKGFETEVYVLKKRMFCKCPVLEEKRPLEVWKGSYKNPSLSELIK